MIKYTNTKVEAVSLEFMKNHSAQEYNPSEYQRSLNRYVDKKEIQFYYCAPSKESGYEYERFFMSYVDNGLRFFKSFNPYSVTISVQSFVKLFILEDGHLVTIEFSNGRAAAVEANFELLRRAYGTAVMITSEF